MNRVEKGVANFSSFTKMMEAFVVRHDTREVDQDKDDEKRELAIKEALKIANDKIAQRQNWIIIIVSILALAVAYLGYLHTVEDSHKGINVLPKIGVNVDNPIDASNQTSADHSILPPKPM